MDLIEIVGLREAHSRTNGVSDHNYERTIFYSFFSLYNDNSLLDMAEQTEIDLPKQKTTSALSRQGYTRSLGYHRIFLLCLFVEDCAGCAP